MVVARRKMVKLVIPTADFDRALELIGPKALIWNSVESWIAVSEYRASAILRALAAAAIKARLEK
jgi:hypothetical protein